jgi:hypothetical protein
MLRQFGDSSEHLGCHRNGETPSGERFSPVLQSPGRICSFIGKVVVFLAVLFLAFGHTSSVARELKMRVRVVGTDGRQAVKDGEVHVDVYDVSGSPVTSYHERRKFIGHRKIKGDNFPLTIPKAGQYKVVATVIQEEDIRIDEPVPVGAANEGDVGSDHHGLYRVTKVTPVFKDEGHPSGTGIVEQVTFTKTYRLMASSGCLTHVAPDEIDGNEDDVFIVVPMQEYVEWWKVHCKFVGSKVIELPLKTLVPGGSIETELTRSVAGNLLVTGAVEPDHFVSADTAVDVFSGAMVTLAFRAAGGPQKFIAELALTYVPPAIVEAVGSQVVLEGVESDDYEHEVVSNIRPGSSDVGGGYVEVKSLGPAMRNVRVLVKAASSVSTQPASIPASETVAEIATNATRRIPWKVNRTQMGNSRADRVIGLQLAYELRHDNVSIPQRCYDYLTSISFDESPDPVVRISVEPATQSVHQGDDATFQVSVRNLDGEVAAGVTVGIRDAFMKQSQSRVTDGKGEVVYQASSNNMSPGEYEFVFDSATAEELVHVNVIVLPEAVTVEASPETQTVRPGETADFEVTVKKLNGGPAPFAEVSVEDPFLKESRSLASDAQGKAHYESKSKETHVGAHRFNFSSPGADAPATATVLVAREPTLTLDVKPAVQTIDVGQTAVFEVRATKLDGSPAPFVTIVVEDPYLRETRSITTDAKGVARYGSQAGDTAPGVYQFVFSSPKAAESVSAEVDVRGGEEFPHDDEGMLDVVVLIDKSGSMSDDIECVQQEVDTMLGDMETLAQQENISLQVGLVLFSYTGAGNVFEECRLSEDIDSTRQFVKKVNPQEVGGDEDLYSALMYAMDVETVEGKKIKMGWRHGAAKITIPITDEAPKSDNFNVLQVAKRAKELDPVHMYPLIMPKTPLSWLEPTESPLNELARVTDGQAIKVQDAKALPQAIVEAVKLAIRRHKEEIYRKENPPYLLYGVAGGMGVVLVILVFGMLVTHRRRTRVQTAPVAPPIASDLTGDTAFREEPD